MPNTSQKHATPPGAKKKSGRPPKGDFSPRVPTGCWYLCVRGLRRFTGHDQLLAALTALNGPGDLNDPTDVSRTWGRFLGGICSPSIEKIAAGEKLAPGSSRAFHCPAWKVLSIKEYIPGCLLQFQGAVRPELMQTVLSGEHPDFMPGYLLAQNGADSNHASKFIDFLELYAATMICLDMHILFGACRRPAFRSMALLYAARAYLGAAFSQNGFDAYYGDVCALADRVIPVSAFTKHLQPLPGLACAYNVEPIEIWATTSRDIEHWISICMINDSIREFSSLTEHTDESGLPVAS